MTDADHRLPAYREDVYRADDEISLYDIYWALLRRKWLIVGVTAACIVLGVLYALLREPSYEYTTTIEIGRIIEQISEDEFSITRIDTPSSLQPLLSGTVIPMIRSEMVTQAREDVDEDAEVDRPPRVNVSVPEDSERIVNLRSEGSAERGSLINDVHERVLTQLTSEHDDEVERVRNRLERRLDEAESELEADLDANRTAQETARNEIEDLEREKAAFLEQSQLEEQNTRARLAEAKRQLERLEQRREALQSQVERLESERERLEGRIVGIEDSLTRAREREQDAAAEAGDEPRAMTLLMLQSSIQDMQNRLDRLEDQRFNELPQRRDELEIDLEELEDERESAQDTIAERETQLANIQSERERNMSDLDDQIETRKAELETLQNERERRDRRFERLSSEIESSQERLEPTRARVVALQSLDPVGASGKLIVALAAVLGGMLGVFGAFLGEFVAGARRFAEAEVED